MLRSYQQAELRDNETMLGVFKNTSKELEMLKRDLMTASHYDSLVKEMIG